MIDDGEESRRARRGTGWSSHDESLDATLGASDEYQADQERREAERLCPRCDGRGCYETPDERDQVDCPLCGGHGFEE